jgi:arylsulfatase A-like enzyme
VELETDGMNVAAILRDNGYRTGFCGKFHLTAHELLGTNGGWEKGGLLTYDPSINPLNDPEVSKKIKHNHDFWTKKIAPFGFDYVQGVYSANARELFNDHLKGHNVEWTADAALRFLDGHKTDNKPFFLYMATTYPHGPAPERRIKGKLPMSLDQDVRLTGEGVVTRDMSLSPNRETIRKRFDKHENPKAVTAAWWDTAVGAVLQKIRDLGQEENTLIIYASDHGKANGGKTTLYETGCHIPLIMQWKGTVQAGQTYAHLAANLDYVPTILDVCGIPHPAALKTDGVSLKPVLAGSKAPVRDALLLEMGYARAIKTDRWKYIAVRYPKEMEKQIAAGKSFKGFRGGAPLERPSLIDHKQLAQKSASKNPHYFERNQLYDLQTDPKEADNLFTQHPERAKELQRIMTRQLVDRFMHRPFGEFNKNMQATKVGKP